MYIICLREQYGSFIEIIEFNKTNREFNIRESINGGALSNKAYGRWKTQNMKIVNVFDAVREGDFKEFKSLYKGNINKINEYSQMNLLQTSLINTYNEAGRLKIIKFLIRKGIDVNYRDCKYQRNALHIFFFNFLHGNAVYLENVVNVLLNAGISVNAVDKYNAVPLKYAITVCRLKTEELRDVYNIMLKAGADCNLKDVFGKSCIDYAKELAWRTEFIRIVEEVQNTIMGKRIGFCGRSMEDL